MSLLFEKDRQTVECGEFLRYNSFMRYKKQFAGKWVAVKKNKVVAAGSDFAPLQMKIAARKDAASIRFSLVPKGMITGVL